MSDAQPQPKKTRRLSYDELLDQFHEVAQDADAGPDRFRAAKALLSIQSASTVLPDPLDENEVLDRMARIMRGAGVELTRLSFRRAWPGLSGTNQIEAPVEISSIDDNLLTPQQREMCRKPRTMKAAYKLFPETKGPGIPKGYPMSQGPIARKAFIYRFCVKAMLDRLNGATTAPIELKDEPLPQPQ